MPWRTARPIRPTLLRRSGKPGQAVEKCERPLEVRKPLIKAHPEVPWYRPGLGETYLRLGQVRCDMEDVAAAAAAWKRGVRTLRRNQVTRRTAHVPASLLQCRPGGTRGPIGLGNALRGGGKPAEEAMTQLRRAVSMGYRNTDAYRTESALDPLRNRPDFQALMMDLMMPADPLSHSLTSSGTHRSRLSLIDRIIEREVVKK